MPVSCRMRVAKTPRIPQLTGRCEAKTPHLPRGPDLQGFACRSLVSRFGKQGAPRACISKALIWPTASGPVSSLMRPHCPLNGEAWAVQLHGAKRRRSTCMTELAGGSEDAPWLVGEAKTPPQHGRATGSHQCRLFALPSWSVAPSKAWQTHSAAPAASAVPHSCVAMTPQLLRERQGLVGSAKTQPASNAPAVPHGAAILLCAMVLVKRRRHQLPIGVAQLALRGCCNDAPCNDGVAR